MNVKRRFSIGRMKNMLLSIIVPVFNQEKYLKDCLDSLVCQDLEESEVIIVNDGSTDSSEDICTEYCRRFGKFKYVKQLNEGLGAARNKGLDFAVGKYIMFVDSDDAIMNNSLGQLVGYIENRNFDILYFDELICDSELNSKFIVAELPIMNIDVDKMTAMENCFNPSHIWSKIYKREMFKHCRFKNMWYEDMELFPRLLAYAERLGYYKVPIYKYRQHTDTITHNNFDKRNEDVLIAWDHAISISTTNRIYRDAIESAVRNSILNFIYFKTGYAAEYLEWYNRNMICESAVQNKARIPISTETQLVNQIIAYNLTRFIRFASALLKVCIYGGIVKGENYFETDIYKDVVTISINGERISVVELSLKKNSDTGYAIIQEMQKENIISRSNVVKEDLLDRIVIRQAMMHGCRFTLVE